MLSVHPNYQDHDASLGGVVADTFHVIATGCEQLSSLPYKLTVLAP